MFKLIVIAVVAWFIWSKLNNKNRQIIKDKVANGVNMAKSVRVDVDTEGLKNAASNAVEVGKEKGRSILITILVSVTGLLTSILGALIGNDNNSNNLPTIRR